MSGNNKGNNHADLPDWLNDDDKPSKPKKPQANKPKSGDELDWLNDPSLGGDDGDDLDWLGDLGADDPLASLGGEEDDDDWLTAGAEAIADEEAIANNEDNLPPWLKSAKPQPTTNQPLSNFDEDNLDQLLGGGQIQGEPSLFDEEEPAGLDLNAPIEANTELPPWLASAKIVETKPEPTPQIDPSALANLFGDEEDELVSDWLGGEEITSTLGELDKPATPAGEPEPELEMDWLTGGAELGADDWLTGGLGKTAEPKPEDIFASVTPAAEPEPELEMDWLTGGAELGADDWLTGGLGKTAEPEPEDIFASATPAAEPEPELEMDWLTGGAELGADDWLTGGLGKTAEPEPEDIFASATPAAEPEPELEIDWLTDGAELGADDWLGEGLGKTAEPEPEDIFASATPAAEPEPELEIDWLTGGSELGADDWLGEGLGKTAEPEPEDIFASATPAGEPEPEEVTLPDWLSSTETISADALDTGHSLMDVEEMFTSNTVNETAEGLPDWLAENPQLPSTNFLEESNADNDWLAIPPAGAVSSEEESTELTDGLPDWLASSTEEVRAEEVQKPETAWLHKDVVESEPESVELEWPTTTSLDPAEVEASLPDWLVDNTEPELVTSTAVATENEVPDWLMPPTETTSAEELGEAELATLPDWLASSQPIKTEPTKLELAGDELEALLTTDEDEDGFFGPDLGLDLEEPSDPLADLVDLEVEPEELAELDSLDTLEPTPAGDESAEFAGFFDREEPTLDSLTSEEDELDGFFSTDLGLDAEEPSDPLADLVDLEVEPEELAELDSLDTLEPTPAGDESAEFAGFFDREEPTLDSLTSEEDELDGFFSTDLGLDAEEPSDPLADLVDLEVEPEELAELDSLDTLEPTPAGDESAEFAGFFDREEPTLDSLTSEEDELDGFFGTDLGLDAEEPSDPLADLVGLTSATTDFTPAIETEPDGDEEAEFAGFFNQDQPELSSLLGSDESLDELFPAASTPTEMGFEDLLALDNTEPNNDEETEPLLHPDETVLDNLFTSTETTAFAPVSEEQLAGFFDDLAETPLVQPLSEPVLDELFASAEMPIGTPEEPVATPPAEPEPPVAVAQTPPPPAEEEKKPKRVRGGGAGMFGGKDDEEITVSAEDLAKAAMSDTKVDGLDIPDDEEAMMAWLLGGMSADKPATQPTVTQTEIKAPEPEPIKPEPVKPEPPVAQTPPPPAEEEKKPKRVRGGGAGMFGGKDDEEITVSAEDLAKAAMSDTKVDGLDIPDDEEAMMAWLLGGMSADKPAAQPTITKTEAKAPEPEPIKPEPVKPEPPVAQTPPPPAEEEKKPKRVRGGGTGMFGGKDDEEITVSAEDLAKAAMSDTKVDGLDIPDDEEAMMAWLLGGMSADKPATTQTEAKAPEPEKPASEMDLESLLANALQDEAEPVAPSETEPTVAEVPTDTASLEDLLAGALSEESKPIGLSPLDDEPVEESESYEGLEATLDMLAQLALQSLTTPAEPQLDWIDESKAQSGTVTDEPPTVDWGATKPTSDLVKPSLPLANNETTELLDERLEWLDNTANLPDNLEPMTPAEPEVVETAVEPTLPEVKPAEPVVKQPETPKVEAKVEPIAKQPEVKKPEPPVTPPTSEKPKRPRGGGAGMFGGKDDEEITVSAEDLAKAALSDTKVDGLDIPDDEEAMMAWLLGSFSDTSSKPATAKVEPEAKQPETPKVEAKVEPIAKQPEVKRVEPVIKQPEVKKPEPPVTPPPTSEKPKRPRGGGAGMFGGKDDEEITVSAEDLAKAALSDTKVDGLDIPDDEEAMMAWLLGGLDDKSTASSSSSKTQPSEAKVTKATEDVDIEDLPDLPSDPDEQVLVFEQLAAQEAEAGRPGQLPPETEDFNELDNLPFVEDESANLDLDAAAEHEEEDLFSDMGDGDDSLSWLTGLGGDDTDQAVNNLVDAALSGNFDTLPEENEEQTTTDELLAIPVEEEIRDPDMDTVDQLLSNDVSESLPDWLSMEPMGASDIDPLDWLDTGSETGVLGWLAAEEETSKTVGQQRPTVTPPSTPTPPKSTPPSTPSIYDTPKPSFVVDEDEPKEEKTVSVHYDPNLFKAARSMIKVGDIEGALETYQEYFGQQGAKVMIMELENVLMSNNHPLLRRLLGDAYMQDGQLQKALDAYSTARDML